MSKKKVEVMFTDSIYSEESLQNLIERAEEVIINNPDLTYSDFYIRQDDDGHGVEWIDLFYRIDETDDQYAYRLQMEERDRKATEDRDRRQYEELKKRFEK